MQSEPEDTDVPQPHPETTPGDLRPESRMRRVKHVVERIVHGMESFAPFILPIRPDRSVAGEVHVGDRTVRYYMHWPDDAALIREWDALSRSVPRATTFQSPYWQRGTARVADAMDRLRVITVHTGNRLVGAVPLEHKSRGAWSTLGKFVTSFDEPLFHPDEVDKTWDAFLRGLLLIDPRLRSLTFDAIPPGAACMSIAPPIARAAGYLGGEIPSHLVDVPAELPGTWDAYVASLKRNTRSKVRRRVKAVDESDRTKYVIADTEATVKTALPKLLDLMQQDGGIKGRRTRWLFRPHLRTVAPILARDGRLTVHQLLIDGELAAGLINLPLADRDLMWNTAMDDRFRDWSPGYALNALAIRHAIQRGCRVFDFLRGMMDYKKELGGVAKPMHRMRFQRSCLSV